MFHFLEVVHVPVCLMWFPGLPVVLKFNRCPEISNCPEILLIWSECPDMDLCYAVVTALHSFCTSLS